MDFSIKHGLALLAVALAGGRAWEQLLSVIRRRWGALSATVSPQVSMFNPLAGAAALAYGHVIGADSALLIATWLHTIAAAATLLISCVDSSGGRV